MKIYKRLIDILDTHLQIITQELEETKRRNTLAGFHAECGKEIYEISNLYPANEVDAAIIFKEWCKGVLSECRPVHKVLREYAEFTADPSQFIKWATNRTKE